MNLIQKIIYRAQRKKYGDPRIIMMWVNGNNRFFLKEGYTIDQLNEIPIARDRKSMIDFSQERWKEWVRLQHKIKKAVNDEEYFNMIFERTLSKSEFAAFIRTHYPRESSSTFQAIHTTGHTPDKAKSPGVRHCILSAREVCLLLNTYPEGAETPARRTVLRAVFI